jgi:hypothetical protein
MGFNSMFKVLMSKSQEKYTWRVFGKGLLDASQEVGRLMR